MQLSTEILSGLSVAVMQVPESIAFSFVAQISPLNGLYSSFFICLFGSALNALPGTISGLAGAMAVVYLQMQQELKLQGVCESQRLELLFMSTIWCGVFEVASGFLQLHRIFEILPQTIVIGFVNGLNIIVIKSQFAVFQVADASQSAGTTEPFLCPTTATLLNQP